MRRDVPGSWHEAAEPCAVCHCGGGGTMHTNVRLPWCWPPLEVRTAPAMLPLCVNRPSEPQWSLGACAAFALSPQPLEWLTASCARMEGTTRGRASAQEHLVTLLAAP